MLKLDVEIRVKIVHKQDEAVAQMKIVTKVKDKLKTVYANKGDSATQARDQK